MPRCDYVKFGNEMLVDSFVDNNIQTLIEKYLLSLNGKHFVSFVGLANGLRVRVFFHRFRPGTFEIRWQKKGPGVYFVQFQRLFGNAKEVHGVYAALKERLKGREVKMIKLDTPPISPRLSPPKSSWMDWSLDDASCDKKKNGLNLLKSLWDMALSSYRDVAMEGLEQLCDYLGRHSVNFSGPLVDKLWSSIKHWLSIPEESMRIQAYYVIEHTLNMQNRHEWMQRVRSLSKELKPRTYPSRPSCELVAYCHLYVNFQKQLGKK